MLLLAMAALAADLPALPKMSPSVSSAYIKYQWCLDDAAKIAATKDYDAAEAYRRSQQACEVPRFDIQAALDTEAAILAAEAEVEGKAAISTEDSIKASEAVLRAIDAHVEPVFTALLRIYREDRK